MRKAYNKLTMDLHPFKEYRQKNNLTQADLGNILNTSHASVSRIEAGKQEVTLELAMKCEELLGISRLSILYPNPPIKSKTHTTLIDKIKNFLGVKLPNPK